METPSAADAAVPHMQSVNRHEPKIALALRAEIPFKTPLTIKASRLKRQIHPMFRETQHSARRMSVGFRTLLSD
jgi:hypothetical protein